MAAAMGDIVEGQRSFRTALHAVADALTSHGFAAHAEKHGTELRIVSENCPFGGMAVEHPVICAVDRGMVKGMLGALYGPSGAATESSLPAKTTFASPSPLTVLDAPASRNRELSCRE